MNTLRRLFQFGCLSAASALTVLIIFGITLAILWAIFPENRGLELTAALLAAALALAISAYLVSRWYSGNKLLAGAIFGFGLSLISFGYILGPDIRLTIFILLGGMLGLAAGRMAQTKAKVFN